MAAAASGLPATAAGEQRRFHRDGAVSGDSGSATRCLILQEVAGIGPERSDTILLGGISGECFEQLSACFVVSRSVRMTYLDGSLDIMSPVGEAHETRKKISA
jgi:hypothetical protein